MKTMMMTAIAAIALSAGVASAQTTSQKAVLGSSDNAEYPLQVQGANGVIYNCKNEIVAVDGVRARKCIAAGDHGAGLFAAGAGVTGAGAAAAAGAVLLVALAASNDDDDAPSTTTTN